MSLPQLLGHIGILLLKLTQTKQVTAAFTLSPTHSQVPNINTTTLTIQFLHLMQIILNTLLMYPIFLQKPTNHCMIAILIPFNHQARYRIRINPLLLCFLPSLLFDHLKDGTPTLNNCTTITTATLFRLGEALFSWPSWPSTTSFASHAPTTHPLT
jgi:hypothetical protein